jgi:group II intron reverse transcriptase/maturase
VLGCTGREVREMRSAETVLGIIRSRGRRGLPLTNVYRQLYNPALYLRAYGRLARNRGALTPGSTPETADGMTAAKIGTIIAALRQERYRWRPVRRTFIAKKGTTKKRPLGLPTWSDKLLQEVVRSLLEAYYEPQFRPSSHGFRPGRGCHTALRTLAQQWTGTRWFIEGDIAQCFDRLDHGILLAILAEQIHDQRFLRLIGHLLQAGYLEDWQPHPTLSGVPQGGVVSPLLANLYLDRLDRFVETTLVPAYTRGTRRRKNAAYGRLVQRSHARARQGQWAEARALRQQYQRLPVHDPDDPGYRRLRYVRYADDFLLGFSGPRAEAEVIREQLRHFLAEQLHLELSEHKTVITHAATEAAHFLGYAITTLQADTQQDRLGRRTLNGHLGLHVPRAVLQTQCGRYLRHGQPGSLFGRTHDTAFSIVARYQQEYRGVVEYYRLAQNLGQLNRLKGIMEGSLVRTLACKHQCSSAQIYRRYHVIFPTPHGPRRGLQVTVARSGKSPLVARWGGIPLARQRDAVLNDDPPRIWNGRTELLERLRADHCELCGATQQVEVHHVRQLKTLQRPGRAAVPTWVETMLARRRKTLVTCRPCHQAIHAGRPMGHRVAVVNTGEPDPSKGRRPVRRGADAKVPG